MNRLLICTSLLLGSFLSLSSCSLRRSEPITGRTVNLGNPHIRNGQILYQRYCYRCHPAGEAGLGPEVLSHPGFSIRFQTRHGMGVMPAFKKKEISRAELNDMMAYLKNLKNLKRLK
jgi:hypothetical protein